MPPLLLLPLSTSSPSIPYRNWFKCNCLHLKSSKAKQNAINFSLPLNQNGFSIFPKTPTKNIRNGNQWKQSTVIKYFDLWRIARTGYDTLLLAWHGKQIVFVVVAHNAGLVCYFRICLLCYNLNTVIQQEVHVLWFDTRTIKSAPKASSALFSLLSPPSLAFVSVWHQRIIELWSNHKINISPKKKRENEIVWISL